MPAGGVGSAPLTGRAAEVGTLAAVLHRACGGVLAAATLEGEAGMGKTRLLDEAHALATAAAAGVLRGVAEEFQRTRPFALVASLLAPVGGAAAELAATISGAPSARSADQPSELIIVDRFVELVEGLASRGPVAVLTDDLQWADRSSLVALQAMVRRLGRLPVAFVGARRPAVTVRALEIREGSLRPLAPTNADSSRGVTDGTGTGGQEITYGFTITNHAQQPLQVTAGLSSSHPADQPDRAAVASIPGGGGTADYAFDVQLASGTAERNATFTATAVSPTATAPVRTDGFTVQVPVDVSVTNLFPTEVVAGTAVEFTATVHKPVGAAFDLQHSTVQFGENVAELQSPVVFGSGSQSEQVVWTLPEVRGALGQYPATATIVGEDVNLAAVELSRPAGVVTVLGMR